MNCLWEVALRADEYKIARESLRYVSAGTYSPYLEVSFVDLNTVVPEERVIEMNPLYRFTAIFAAMMDINLSACPKTRKALLDSCMQYMIQLDLRQGLTKSEYYLRFLLREILGGRLGAQAAQAVRFFTARELRQVLVCMLPLCRCGCSVYLFRRVMRAVYPNSLVYANNDVFREILIYIGKAEVAAERAKVEFLLGVFLPFDYTAHLFWEHHFGIIDVDVSMELDEMAIF